MIISAVAERVGLLEVVGRQEDRRAALAQRADVVPEVGAVLRVKPGAGLIEEQHLGPVDDPERDVEAAALAARVGADAAVGELGQIEQVDQLAARERTDAVSPPYRRPCRTGSRGRSRGRRSRRAG